MGDTLAKTLHCIQHKHSGLHRIHGREARLPVDLMFGPSPTDTTSPNEYMTQLQVSLREAYQRVRTNLTTAHNRQKEYYNQRIHGRPIQPGDLVWLLTTAVPVGHSRKLHCPWTLQGPTETYKIQSRDGKSRIHVVHFSHAHQTCVCRTATHPHSKMTIILDTIS